MAIVETLTPAELARQLANPDGTVGLEVADWLNENNKEANAKTVALLSVEAGHHVLEIGFGNGRTAPVVIAQAPDVRYSGIDISPTMLAEASTFNAALVQAGKASFHLASAHEMPFADDSFDRVFSIGVIHFWTEPVASLVEAQRVLRPGGLMLMGCLAPKEAPDFAQSEYGFYLRDASEWDGLCRKAGFADVNVQSVEFEQITPSGAAIKRYGVMMRARA
ncbi:MAG TPA: class I SAM-dependent methyltransferase [Roseiarcus sp.]|jgi:ubiquinone/menaquinone biosynthesis C-methylase UbiE|nr:class I SAM-dependent methyltransferase [Roseiarcus sp.]